MTLIDWVGVVLTSSAVSAGITYLLGPVVVHRLARLQRKEQWRADLLRHWRTELEAWNSTHESITEAPIYAEISSVLRDEGITLDAIEGRTFEVSPDGYTGSNEKRVLLSAIAELEKKWKLR